MSVFYLCDFYSCFSNIILLLLLRSFLEMI